MYIRNTAFKTEVASTENQPFVSEASCTTTKLESAHQAGGSRDNSNPESFVCFLPPAPMHLLQPILQQSHAKSS